MLTTLANPTTTPENQMRYKKMLAAAAFLIGAALSQPLVSQIVKKPAMWLVISCNTDGTYTCANEPCIGNACCPI